MSGRIRSMRQDRFRQEVLMALLLEHPELLNELDEDLQRVTLDQDLDKLLRELQNLMSSGANLDAGTVSHHFASGGGGALLRTLQDPKILQAIKPARHPMALEDVRRTVEDILRVQSQNALAGELRSATSRAADEGDEARILALRESYANGEASGVISDDDGV